MDIDVDIELQEGSIIDLDIELRGMGGEDMVSGLDIGQKVRVVLLLRWI